MNDDDTAAALAQFELESRRLTELIESCRTRYGSFRQENDEFHTQYEEFLRSMRSTTKGNEHGNFGKRQPF